MFCNLSLAVIHIKPEYALGILFDSYTIDLTENLPSSFK